MYVIDVSCNFVHWKYVNICFSEVFSAIHKQAWWQLLKSIFMGYGKMNSPLVHKSWKNVGTNRVNLAQKVYCGIISKWWAHSWHYKIPKKCLTSSRGCELSLEYIFYNLLISGLFPCSENSRYLHLLWFMPWHLLSKKT